MKLKFFLSFCLAAVLSASAQGYKDGVEYFKAGQYENAKELLERNMNDASTDKATAYYYLGAIALHDKDYATAKADFEKGLAANPTSALNKVGLGELELLQGNAKAAESYFDEAKKINKKDATVLTSIGRAYFNADPVKYESMIDKYDAQAYKANAKSPDIFMLRGDRAALKKEWGEVNANYDNAILYSKTLPEAYVKYADVIFPVNPATAIEKLEQLLSVNPTSALGQRELAEKYYQNDQWAKAAQAYGEYINNPNHFKSDEVRYSVLLYYGKHYNESLDLARKILANDPNNFQLRRIEFLNLVDLEKYPEAEKAAQKFFALNDPKAKYSANDYTKYAEVLQELDKDSLAVLEYEKAIEVNPEKADLYKALSSAYNSMKNYDKSLEVFKIFVEKDPSNINDIVTLSQRYQNVAATSEPGSEKKLAAIDSALATIDKVIATVPENPIPVRNKARMYLVKYDNQPSQEMLDTYNNALELLDKDPANKEKRVEDYKEAYSMIASYYISQRDIPNAKIYYEKVYELDPTNTALREYIDKMK
ncbi:MAG: tetratricopeptide repeat protein [Muribaculum sp.]|nr:tetratricopeptide repeat protein [Muribaculaceae bacterium]MCM1081342.1 tetratricopeptide repeat protein [Muribaculum sp.]